jgi:hypothetical protein
MVWVMKKPENIENPKLKKLVDRLWTNDPTPIGDGSVADAVRHEKKTGEQVKDAEHSQKARDYIKSLEKWFGSKTSPKPDSDKKIAREIIKDLKDALKGE